MVKTQKKQKRLSQQKTNYKKTEQKVERNIKNRNLKVLRKTNPNIYKLDFFIFKDVFNCLKDI